MKKDVIPQLMEISDLLAERAGYREQFKTPITQDTILIHAALESLLHGDRQDIFNALAKAQGSRYEITLAWEDMLKVGEYMIDGQLTEMYVNRSVDRADRSVALAVREEKTKGFNKIKNFKLADISMNEDIKQPIPQGLERYADQVFLGVKDESAIYNGGPTGLTRSASYRPERHLSTLEHILQNNGVTAKTFFDQLKIQLGLTKEESA